ncbi:unnamed protein product [Coffea canephora]|uniref:Uncharacterized protein n=1 Tax=Coffea canephora TaxID=49390 RepID=A0A068VEH6_COFCA|nr:unnamed protein product [Coffea canephora]
MILPNNFSKYYLRMKLGSKYLFFFKKFFFLLFLRAENSIFVPFFFLFLLPFFFSFTRVIPNIIFEPPLSLNTKYDI